jgi:hypothetical protein
MAVTPICPLPAGKVNPLSLHVAPDDQLSVRTLLTQVLGLVDSSK